MKVIIRKYEDRDLETLNNLLKEVYTCKRKGTISSDNIELVAILDNKVVGYMILSKLYDVVNDIYYGHINYVCVLEEYRNKNIATKLLEEVFRICKDEKIKYIELTSNSSRIAAHHLYKKLGFNIRETNVFRKELI